MAPKECDWKVNEKPTSFIEVKGGDHDMQNFYLEDDHLQLLVNRYLTPAFATWANTELENFGARCAGEIDERAAYTDKAGEPKLISYDKFGNEVSKVWVNDGYQKTVQEAYGTGIVGYIHKEIPKLGHSGNYLYAFTQGYLLSQAEAGFYCPVTLTKATAYLLNRYASPEIKRRFLPHVLATGEEKLYEGATFLTERQGGSDVGANEVQAENAGSYYQLSGEKYFASNAGTCGVAMVLARVGGGGPGTKGLSLFAVPWEENRENGGLRIRRLKNKLGVRAVPSAEVEFYQAKAYLVGELHRGFTYMMEALNLSRVANAVASVGIMRRAYIEAKNYAKHRSAFGKQLTDYPMIRDTLSTMAAKQEVYLSTLFTMIQLMDKVMGDDGPTTSTEQILFRLYVAIMKKETAEQAIHFAHEAIEMHGGNGYIEDFVTPRLLRDAQVLTVWEGTANTLGLEVIRLIDKFQVDELFIMTMIERLERVKGICQIEKEIVHFVENGIAELQTYLEQWKELDGELQTFYSKHLADRMTKILTSIVAMEEAVKGNAREVAVSEVYLHKMWNHNEISADPIPLKHYEGIVESNK